MSRVVTLCVVVLLFGACAETGAPASTPTRAPSETATAPVRGTEPPETATTPVRGTEPPATTTPPNATATPRDNPPSAGPPISLASGDFAVVATDDLRLRSQPWVGADSTVFEPSLPRGAVLLVAGVPVASSGYWWYRVSLIGTSTDQGYTEGWVAAGDQDGTPWLTLRPAASLPGTYLALSSPGDGRLTPTARVQLDGGLYHMVFSGVARCGYSVRFGPDLEWELGFDGSTLSTVRWPQEFPEPSAAPLQDRTSIAFPPLPKGKYRLRVSDGGSTSLPCPWEVALTP